MIPTPSVDPDGYEFVPIGPSSDCLPGERLFVSIDDVQIIVVNIAGQFFAIGDVCSHDNNILDDAPLEGYQIVCPRHGARFDVRNGRVLSLPAVEDIPSYPVRIQDGQIEIGLKITA